MRVGTFISNVWKYSNSACSASKKRKVHCFFLHFCIYDVSFFHFEIAQRKVALFEHISIPNFADQTQTMDQPLRHVGLVKWNNVPKMQNDCFNLTLLTQISLNMCYTNEISLLLHVLSGQLSDASCIVPPAPRRETQEKQLHLWFVWLLQCMYCVLKTQRLIRYLSLGSGGTLPVQR